MLYWEKNKNCLLEQVIFNVFYLLNVLLLQWAKVNKAKFGILELQMDPSNNFGSYRSCLKAAMWRAHGATDRREKVKTHV